MNCKLSLVKQALKFKVGSCEVDNALGRARGYRLNNAYQKLLPPHFIHLI